MDTHVHVCMLDYPFQGNHRAILDAVGFTDIREYRYWNADSRNLDFDGMLEDLKVSGGG